MGITLYHTPKKYRYLEGSWLLENDRKLMNPNRIITNTAVVRKEVCPL